jgi:hypothetical protein
MTSANTSRPPDPYAADSDDVKGGGTFTCNVKGRPMLAKQITGECLIDRRIVSERFVRRARWLRTGPRGHRQDGKRTHGAATTASERLTQLTPINITIYPYPGVECEGVVEPAGRPKNGPWRCRKPPGANYNLFRSVRRAKDRLGPKGDLSRAATHGAEGS